MASDRTEFIVKYLRVAAWSVLLGAVGASIVVSLIVYNVMLDDFTRSIRAGIVNLSSNALKDGVSVENTAGIEQLEGVVGPLLKAKSYLGVSVYGADGELVFRAPDSDMTPLSNTEQEAIQAALNGRVHAQVETYNGVQVYHVVAPLNHEPGSPAPGVLSGRRPLWLFLEGTLQTITLLTMTILLFAGVAYALLWGFAERAKREVDRHAAVSAALQRRLSTSLKDAELQVVGTLQALSAAVDAKDAYTAQHSLNVADYACAIAREMGREDLCVSLERAGLLHDIGKIGVGEAQLRKPASLTKTELASVAEHSRLGAKIIETIPFLVAVVPIITHHHEWWDGTGYPKGLAGDQIPIESRILATADAFDAMTTSRPYRAALPMAEARSELLAGRATQFDPGTVDALLGALDAGRLRLRGEAASRSEA